MRFLKGNKTNDIPMGLYRGLLVEPGGNRQLGENTNLLFL